jgi:hypothetical protein
MKSFTNQDKCFKARCAIDFNIHGWQDLSHQDAVTKNSASCKYVCRPALYLIRSFMNFRAHDLNKSDRLMTSTLCWNLQCVLYHVRISISASNISFASAASGVIPLLRYDVIQKWSTALSILFCMHATNNWMLRFTEHGLASRALECL